MSRASQPTRNQPFPHTRGVKKGLRVRALPSQYTQVQGFGLPPVASGLGLGVTQRFYGLGLSVGFGGGLGFWWRVCTQRCLIALDEDVIALDEDEVQVVEQPNGQEKGQGFMLKGERYQV